ncbi:MAG: hypothetical protein FWH36_06755 [Lentimicrobiaceae bacterium]|nr:hypothetical protein [Lentimicrobiaceae bacterium]
MNRINYFQKISSKLIVLLTVTVFLSLQFSDADLYAQSNRKKQKNNFSSIGKREARIRHGIALNFGAGLSANLQQPMSIVPTIGMGYCAAQYYGVGNRFMQQTVTYQLGYGLANGGYIVHNLAGTFHCSYIGTLDLNPFIYGIAMQFAYYGGDRHFTSPYANFYIRPEIGFAFPFKYKVRTEEVQRVTGSLTYGFNIKTNYSFNENDPNCVPGKDGEVILPWTAMNHHVITLRLNINLKNMREMRK